MYGFLNMNSGICTLYSREKLKSNMYCTFVVSCVSAITTVHCTHTV